MTMQTVTNLADYNIPLVTDLDGTLIKGDILYIGILKLLKKNIFYLIKCMWWLFKGKANLKEKIFAQVYIDPLLLNYNKDTMLFLKGVFEKGRKIILATATVKSVACDIAAHCGFFSQVYGSESNINLKGSQKAKRLILQFGENGFDYIGDSSSDLFVFKFCRFAYLVNPSGKLEKETRKIAIVKNIWS